MSVTITPWQATESPGVFERQIGCFLLEVGPTGPTFGLQVFDHDTCVHRLGGMPTLELAQIVAETWIGQHCISTIESVTAILNTVRETPEVVTLLESFAAAREQAPDLERAKSLFSGELAKRIGSPEIGGAQ